LESDVEVERAEPGRDDRPREEFGRIDARLPAGFETAVSAESAVTAMPLNAGPPATAAGSHSATLASEQLRSALREGRRIPAPRASPQRRAFVSCRRPSSRRGHPAAILA
jgi:hypothetical protein